MKVNDELLKVNTEVQWVYNEILNKDNSITQTLKNIPLIWWLVQKIQDLSDGSGINVTIAKYLTPDGSDINKIGIQPDVKVELTKEDYVKHRDPQLKMAKQVIDRLINQQDSK